MRRRRPLRPGPARLAGAVVLAALAAAGTAGAQPAPCTHWIATNGTDSAGTPGTSAQPWRTIDFASARLLALGLSGSVVCLKDGVYTGGNSVYERFASPTTFRAENAYRAVLQNNSRVLQLFGSRNLVFEGLEMRHTGAGADALVVQVQMGDGNWAEDVVFRNNILHDSWNNDILKINNGARRITVEGNVFYNQTGSDEHMDVNSVTDVVIQDNIFFNDFAGSGRPNNNDTSSFIVMKDSNQDDDQQIGADRITVRRNVFLNWEGGGGSNFVLIGEDGNDYFEGEDILVENNLMVGNSSNDMRAAFGVKGGRNVTFRSNTVTGNLPALAYAFRINREGANPVNENVRFHNNVWSDPTGTMGAEAAGGTNDFSDGEPNEVTGLVLDRNLYWNGPAPIPAGNQVNPNVNDTRRIVANPQLNTNQAGVVLPRWNGTAFVSGSTTIRQEFVRLVNLYGAIPAGSPGHNQADAALSPADDILGNPRSTPDLGAYEVSAPPTLSIADLSVPEGAGTGTFTVSLSTAAGSAVTVSFATSAGTATSGTDFTAVSGVLTFPAGQVTRPVAVPIAGDALDEPDETFLVTLSAPSGAALSDGQATGTIQDDDLPPVLNAADCSVVEGDAGSVPCVVNVSLTAASGRTVTAAYTSSNGSALAGSDYTAVSGTLTFAPGTTSRSVSVPVLGDAVQEGDETFGVVLSAPANATLNDGIGTGFILDDDTPSVSSLELTHGSVLRADLAGGAADFYRIAQSPYASYEVVLDETAGDAVPGLRLERLNTSSTLVTQSALPVGTGSALSLRWQNSTFGSPLIGEPLRVSAPACGSGCGADDTYRLRAYETTATIARFNNTGSQTTFLFVQNVSASPVTGRIDFWSPAGNLIASSALGPLAPRALLVLNTSSVTVQGGSITIANNGPYGALAGKGVSLEPATGFSFDSPLTYRPR
jgi:hypothetical protein